MFIPSVNRTLAKFATASNSREIVNFVLELDTRKSLKQLMSFGSRRTRRLQGLGAQECEATTHVA